MKDYFGYQEKVVIVTGASSGMGKATAEMLVDLGAKVYALDWNICDVKGVEKFVHVDLSKKDSIDQAMKDLPKHIDSFFGIAGVSGMKNDFMTTVSIDFIANKKYYIDAILASGWNATVEAIMKTGFQYLPGTLGYPYSKLAMNYYTAYLQKSFASKKIRVNAVLPGSTDTGMKSEFTEMAHGEEGLLLHCGYANRLAYSKEMAGPIVFLNSEMATYASGVLMEVDYGNTVEERANIKPVQQVISLEDIYQMMQKQSK